MLPFYMEQLMRSEEEAQTLVMCRAQCCDPAPLVIVPIQGLSLREGREVAQELVAS